MENPTSLTALALSVNNQYYIIMVRTIQRLKVNMQYHMDAVSEVSNECVQYMGLPLSHVVLTKWRKQLSPELPFCMQKSTNLFFVYCDF